MGKALYRKYRSKSLDEIVGQGHITAMLRRAITNDTVAHAYLLTGPRGVGKTSIARILAHEINGLPYNEEATHLDIIEIDAASNNSVEDIRDLRERVMIAPSMAPKKIYIIDEVHMLSKSAFNALLKTLEEPPEHVVFILATTDAEKLPATIISRVQRFNFRAITRADAVGHLRHIADAEAIAIDNDALELIAHHGKGSFRDSIGLLDQLRNLTDGTITPELIQNVLGLADTTTVQQLLTAYQQQDIATIVATIDEAEARGTPATALAEQLIVATQSRVTEQPQLLPLLDALLDVAKSTWPHVKLLTVLAGNPTAAGAMPAAVAPKPAVPRPAAPNQKSATAPKAVEPPAPAVPAPIEQPIEPKPHPKKAESGKQDQAFPWAEFIAIIKVDSMGAYSYLASSGHQFDGKTLTIYTGKPFNKKQLDKALPSLAASLEKVGLHDTTITIVAATAPPSNSQAASVLDIMGGGEEVTL